MKHCQHAVTAGTMQNWLDSWLSNKPVWIKNKHLTSTVLTHLWPRKINRHLSPLILGIDWMKWGRITMQTDFFAVSAKFQLYFFHYIHATSIVQIFLKQWACLCSFYVLKTLIFSISVCVLMLIKSLISCVFSYEIKGYQHVVNYFWRWYVIRKFETIIHVVTHLHQGSSLLRFSFGCFIFSCSVSAYLSNNLNKYTRIFPLYLQFTFYDVFIVRFVLIHSYFTTSLCVRNKHLIKTARNALNCHEFCAINQPASVFV